MEDWWGIQVTSRSQGITSVSACKKKVGVNMKSILGNFSAN